MGRINPLEKYAYLVGTKIHKWTVLELKNDRRHADAICQCECGTIKPVNIRNLINDCTKDCGCGRKQRLHETKSKNLVGMKFGKLTVEELLTDSNKFKRRMYRCVCDCGNTIILPSSSLTTYHTLSCGCLVSYYNMCIGKYLSEQKIEYQPEFPVCIDNKRYRFDFYLPAYNLFIEYDGQQHYEPMRYYDNDTEKNSDNLKTIQKRDSIKNQYCQDKHINLLRIPYWETKNFETIISDCLQRLSEKGFIGHDPIRYATV